jgi:hypothetical protein
MRNRQQHSIAKLPSALVPPLLRKRLVQVRLWSTRVLYHKLLQTSYVVLQLHLPLKDALRKFLHLKQFWYRLYVNLLNSSKVRLAVTIYHKSSRNTLNDTFIVLLHTLYKILDCLEKLLVEVSIEKLISFYSFSISNLQLFLKIYLITGRDSNKFTRFALNNMIFPHTFHPIAFIELTRRHPLLNHFPLLIETLVSQLILPNNLQKLYETNLQNVPINRLNLKSLLLIKNFRIFSSI